MDFIDPIEQLGRRLEGLFSDGPQPPKNGHKGHDGNNDDAWMSISLRARDVSELREIADCLLKHTEEFRTRKIPHAISVCRDGQMVDAWTWAPELPN